MSFLLSKYFVSVCRILLLCPVIYITLPLWTTTVITRSLFLLAPKAEYFSSILGSGITGIGLMQISWLVIFPKKIFRFRLSGRWHCRQSVWSDILFQMHRMWCHIMLFVGSIGVLSKERVWLLVMKIFIVLSLVIFACFEVNILAFTAVSINLLEDL